MVATGARPRRPQGVGVLLASASRSRYIPGGTNDLS